MRATPLRPTRASAAALVAALVAAAHLAACSSKEAPPPPAAALTPEAQPLEDPALTEFVPEDPAEAARAAAFEDARARYRALRDGYLHGSRATPVSRARLERALAAVKAPAPPRWQIACRGRACRVASELAPAVWHGLVEAEPSVRTAADRLAADPDHRDPALYVLLAEEDAAPGDDLLVELERALRASPEPRACAARAEASGTVEYELRVDESGFTYRTGGDLPWPVVDCVNDALAGLLREIEVPPSAKSATRIVALRL